MRGRIVRAPVSTGSPACHGRSWLYAERMQSKYLHHEDRRVSHPGRVRIYTRPVGRFSQSVQHRENDGERQTRSRDVWLPPASAAPGYSCSTCSVFGRGLGPNRNSRNTSTVAAAIATMPAPTARPIAAVAPETRGSCQPLDTAADVQNRARADEPIPVTICAATRAGSWPPPKPYTETRVKSAAPTATIPCVPTPAAFPTPPPPHP